MLKVLRAFAILSPLLLPIVGFAHPTVAQDLPEEPSFGVCSLPYYELSGRSMIDSTGRLVSLQEYCRARVVDIVSVAATPESDEFWKNFTAIASPLALEQSRSFERADVVAYAATICPTLATGVPLSEVRRVQARGPLTASFDAAVNVAAINTYCPEYRNQIGRR